MHVNFLLHIKMAKSNTSYYLTLILASFAYYCLAQDQCIEGFQTKKGDFWYVCEKSVQKPIACINSDGDRIDIGSSYQSDKYVYQCSLQNSDIKLTPTACISQGRRVEINDTYTNDQTQFYKCSKGANGNLSIESAGCVGSDGKALKDGETVIRGNTVYTCSSNKTGITLVPQGCLFEGKQYKLNDTVDSFGVFYKCEKSTKGDMGVNLKGCLENKTRYEIGKRWNDGFFVFECQKVAGAAMRVGMGCVEQRANGTKKVEYKPGDKWQTDQSGGASNRYLITCIKEGLTIKRQGIACFYNISDGVGYLAAGCMKKVGFQIIQCAAPTGPIANVRIRITENPTAADEKRLKDSGMKFCDNITPDNVKP